ncbi:M48 family metalloprotease [candidate division FCPU426 bacterium]|nr:M48 family metalloprotease [candidate division FCPU426 bacterium]
MLYLRIHCLALPLLLLVSGCATLGSAIKIGGTLSGYQELNDLGSSMEKAGRQFNAEEQYFIGRTVAATLLADDARVDDRALTVYVNAIGQTLALASDMPELFQGYHFAVLNAPKKLNAYACPGGFLFVTSGLLRHCRTEDELAAVLAHELAHVVLDHPIQAIQAGHQRAAVASLVKFGVRAASESKSELKELSGLFNNVVQDVVRAVAQGYSREKEKEADLMAVAILIKAGYAPTALADVLGRLDQHSCHHGDPRIRAQGVEAKVREKGSAREVLAARTLRFKKAVP